MATLKKFSPYGKWYSDVRINGVRRNIALSFNKHEARRMLEDMVLEARASRRGLTPDKTSWIGFKDRFLKYIAWKAPKTIFRDKWAIEKLEEYKPIRYLSEITPGYLDELKTIWTSAKITDSMTTRGIKSIKAMMRVAEKWELVKPQAWGSVHLEESPGRLTYYTVEELSAFINGLSGNWKTAAMLMGRNGLRGGEAYFLQWEDVDFERQIIRIRPKMYVENGIEKLWRPKGFRKKQREWSIELGEDVAAYLMPMRRESGWVMSEDRMTQASFYTYFKRLVKRAGLPGSAHTLRHTFAAHLVSNGASLEQVAALLGHGNNTKTTRIYAHLMPHATRAAIKKLPPLHSAFTPLVAHHEP